MACVWARAPGQGGLGKRTFVNTLFAAQLLARDAAPRSRKEESRIRITEAGMASQPRPPLSGTCVDSRHGGGERVCSRAAGEGVPPAPERD
jgi:hypothetical protein